MGCRGLEEEFVYLLWIKVEDVEGREFCVGRRVVVGIGTDRRNESMRVHGDVLNGESGTDGVIE